jgi:hypothetical protein
LDPFVKTIVTQSGLIVLGFLAVGAAIAMIYGVAQYGKLQYALTLDLIPPPLP